MGRERNKGRRLDLHPALQDEHGNMKLKYTTDGLHLSSGKTINDEKGGRPKMSASLRFGFLSPYASKLRSNYAIFEMRYIAPSKPSVNFN